MSKIFRKNQLIVTSLAIMIAVAGYLNFSGEESLMVSELSEETVQRISDEQLNLPEGEIGEAVLTSAGAADFVAAAKVNREQSYAKAKSNLESIINSESADSSSKEDAAAQLSRMSERLEKQTAAENLLGTKGFLNSVVTIHDDSVDVVVTSQNLSAVSRAQIEDTVSRTCGCNLDQIVITKMKLED